MPTYATPALRDQYARQYGTVAEGDRHLYSDGYAKVRYPDGTEDDLSYAATGTPTNYAAQGATGADDGGMSDYANVIAQSQARQQAAARQSQAGGLGAIPAAGAPAAGASPFAAIQQLLTGGTSAAPTDATAALQQAAQQYGDIGTAKAQLAKMQYDQAAANLQASRKWTPADWFSLSAAMSAPSRTPGFGGFLQNVMPVLSQIAQSHYQTPEMLAQKKAALQMQYLGALADARRDALKDQGGIYRDILEYGGKGDKTRTGFNPITGQLINMETSLPVQPPAPEVGEIRDGYRFKGGDPAVKSNWEQVR